MHKHPHNNSRFNGICITCTSYIPCENINVFHRTPIKNWKFKKMAFCAAANWNKCFNVTNCKLMSKNFRYWNSLSFAKEEQIDNPEENPSVKIPLCLLCVNYMKETHKTLKKSKTPRLQSDRSLEMVKEQTNNSVQMHEAVCRQSSMSMRLT